MEDGLTPAQQNAQAEPTNATATVGADALDEVAKTAERANGRTRAPREANNTPPHNMLYIGNLYYEVTADQLKNVFSRFGEIDNVRIVYDNRGLSRG
jgi:nucleolin